MRTLLVQFAMAMIGLAILLTCGTARPAQAQTYIVSSIGPVGTTGTHPYAVNDLGQAVGQYYTQAGTSSYRAFLYDIGNPAAGVQILPDFPGSVTTQANGINHAGQVVGYGTSVTGSISAFLWDATNGTRQIDQIADTSGNTSAGMGWTLGLARAINSRGDILCQDSSGQRMCIWRMTADAVSGATTLTVTAVPNISGWRYSGLNDNGVALTDAVNPSTGVVAFGLWDSGAGLFNTFIDPSFKQGYALNNLGVAVSHYGQIYRPGVGVSLLGIIGSGNSEGWGVNDANQVVGISSGASRTNIGFLWQNGVMKSLQSLSNADKNWNLAVASALSNPTNSAGTAGYIVGWGAYKKVATGWILSPK